MLMGRVVFVIGVLRGAEAVVAKTGVQWVPLPPLALLPQPEATMENEQTPVTTTIVIGLIESAERRKALRKKIADGGRRSLTQRERKEAQDHGLVPEGG